MCAQPAGEFGNPDPPQCQQGYEGVALTLIDTLSTLAVIGNKTEFEKGVWWLTERVRCQSPQPQNAVCLNNFW